MSNSIRKCQRNEQFERIRKRKKKKKAEKDKLNNSDDKTAFWPLHVK